MQCSICGKIGPADDETGIEQAIELGWEPSYWLDDSTPGTGPVCGACSAAYLTDHANDPVLRAGLGCQLASRKSFDLDP